ncbi:MAG: hypothetical protein ACQUHE_11070 [Bacteroidia bacterium]
MKSLSFRLYFTGAITIAIWAILVWNHFNGGVSSHHLLHRKDLPEISNWWSGLLIPFSTLFLTYRAQKRMDQQNIMIGFLAALIYGIALSVTFFFGYTSLTSYLFRGVILLALFFPIYRAESLLGFVLGMTTTFGAVLSTAAGILLVIFGLVLHLYIRRVILFIFKTINTWLSPQNKTMSIIAFLAFLNQSQAI